MIIFRRFVTVNSYRPGMENTQLYYQAGPYVSNSDIVKNDETVDNESMDGEHVPFSTALSKYSNAIGKRPIAGPSVNRNKR